MSRSLARLLLVSAALPFPLVGACSDGTVIDGAGGAAASGGTGGVAGGDPWGGAGAGGGGTFPDGAPSDNDAAPDTPPACAAGTVECEGTLAKVCDGQGGHSEVTECAPLKVCNPGVGCVCPAGTIQCNGTVKTDCVETYDCAQDGKVCVSGIGCVVCQPGTGTCQGDVGTYCKADGSGYASEICDAVQGTTCDPQTGRCEGACAQKEIGTSYIGCDYYPTVTANPVDPALFNFAVAVSNTKADPATVTVTKGLVPVTTVTVAANSVEIIKLPWELTLKGPNGLAPPPVAASMRVDEGAYRLRSTQPVTVYQFSPLEYQTSAGNCNLVLTNCSYSNDASLLIPTNAWTGKYRVATWQSFSTNTSGFFAVVARDDNTSVTITPAPNGGQVKPGIPELGPNGAGTVVLHSGDVIQVVTVQGGDTTGTLVTADRPVQVLGGHQCPYVPDDRPACDHLEDVMFPSQTLANEYIVTAHVIPTQPGPVPQYIRIVATEPGTTLTYSPAQAGAPGSIAEAGGFVQIANNASDFVVTSNKPILVAQYMRGQGQGANDQGSGDPSLALAVAKEQFRTSYLFHAPTNYQANYVNIVAPTGAAVQLDGAPVDGFAPIGATSYSVARKQLSNTGNGNHTVTSAEPVGIMVYGFGAYTSYWYAGGSDLEKLHE